ncbi:hypothetical protein BH23CHL5_BH23CHL5_25100 [soil metagenome]
MGNASVQRFGKLWVHRVRNRGAMAVLKNALFCSAEIDDWTSELDCSFIERLPGLVRTVLVGERQGGSWNIAITFCSDVEITEMHRQHLADESPTDILTFDYGVEPASGNRTGEIVISTDRASEQANDVGWSLDEELTFLVIHGVLHLCNWDDSTENDRTAMLDRQHELMNRSSS